MSDIQIVAEIGCNHNGSVELAKTMNEQPPIKKKGIFG